MWQCAIIAYAKISYKTFQNVPNILTSTGVSQAVVPVFTARCYASAVLAMGLCLSVSVSVSVCHKPVFY